MIFHDLIAFVQAPVMVGIVLILLIPMGLIMWQLDIIIRLIKEKDEGTK